FVAEDQADVQAREPDQRLSARVVELAAHGEEELLLRLDVLGGDVPVAHREAGVVVGRQLCDRGGGGQRRGERERGEQHSFHGDPPAAYNVDNSKRDGGRIIAATFHEQPHQTAITMRRQGGR